MFPLYTVANNLLYAKTISPQARKEANKIIRESLWLDYNAFDSWFVKNGTIENCMDADIHMIQNEKIDEISKVINEDFERLLEMKKNNRKTHSKSIEKSIVKSYD